MGYLVRVKRLSTIDELREGSSATIELSRWQLNPEPDLDTEAIDEVLKPGSDFSCVTCGGADADTTITLWVYPDSFDMYRKFRNSHTARISRWPPGRFRWAFLSPVRRKVRGRPGSDLQQ